MERVGMMSAGCAALAGDSRSQGFGVGQPHEAVGKSDFEIRVECRFTPARRPRKLACVLKSTWVGVSRRGKCSCQPPPRRTRSQARRASCRVVSCDSEQVENYKAR